MANRTLKSATGQLDLIPREIRVLASGVVHLPNFLLLSEQNELVASLRKWTEGGWYTPAMPNGVPMAHPLACLGYRWKPYGYFSARSPLPGELINLAVLALSQARSEEYLPYFPQTAIVNFFPVGSSLGMHQDRSETEKIIQQGRYAWMFSDVLKLIHPVDFKGRQRLTALPTEIIELIEKTNGFSKGTK